ncbi:MAG: periplasmic heavy metal sensor [Terriglobia bacterium]
MNAKLKFAFLASLLVNVFLVGVLLGELPRRFDEGLSREERMEKAIEELPEPLRAQFRGKMERMREGSEQLRDQIQEAREEALRILIAELFDGTAYDRQVSKIHELYGQRAKRMAELVKEVAKDLPPEQRQVLAEVLKRPSSPSPR